MTWKGIVDYLCALNVGLPRFRYPLGAVVYWADSPEAAQPWRIAARRVTEGEVSQYTEYLLVSQGTPEAPTKWVYEPDIEEVA